MQKFPSPNDRLMLNRMSLDRLLEKDSLLNAFPIHSIHLLVPGDEELLESFTEKLTSPENIYFIIKDVTLSTLIQTTFIKNFVKAGSLWAFSHNSDAEEANFFSITPSGKLIVSLEKGIASSLSLAKESSSSLKKNARKAIYKFDLVSPDFLPGKKLYDSVSSEFNKLNHITFEMLVKWESEENVCPESIRSYFKIPGCESLTCEPNYTHSSKISVPTPKINFEQFDSSVAEDIFEWVGAQVCNIDLSEEVDGFVSNFKVSEPSEVLTRLQMGLYEGFYSGTQICNLLKESRNLFTKYPKVPFLVLSISGYQDCYIDLEGCKKFSSADKMITILIPPNLQLWVETLNVT